MKHFFKTVMVGLFLSGSFLFSSYKVNAQWNLVGNSGTTPGTNFLGTTDAQDLVFKTNNVEYLRLTSAGNLTYQAPAASLTLNNNSSMYGNTYLNFTNHGTTTFTMGVGSYPSCGSGIFRMFPGGTGSQKGINFSGTGITFGVANYGICSGTISANYLFDASVGAPTLVVADGSPSFSQPSGYALAVQHDSYLGGKLAIGTTNTPNDYTSGSSGYRLYVAGGILTEKLRVGLLGTGNWADFVFDKSYKLPSLSEVEKFIEANKHLPEVPSAEEVVKNGINVAEMDAKLLQKIEELTLYMIEMEKKMAALEKKNQELEKKILN